jgi:hypothetical protein
MRNEIDFCISVAAWWSYDLCSRTARIFRAIACRAQDRRLNRLLPPDQFDPPF